MGTEEKIKRVDTKSSLVLWLLGLLLGTSLLSSAVMYSLISGLRNDITSYTTRIVGMEADSREMKEGMRELQIEIETLKRRFDDIGRSR